MSSTVAFLFDTQLDPPTIKAPSAGSIYGPNQALATISGTAVDLPALANELEIAGGSIRNIALAAAYMAATLSSDMDDTDSVKIFHDDAVKNHLVILPPDINQSVYRFLPVDRKHVRYGLGAVKSITPWALFVIFVLGPCEPLIPVLMYPASQHSLWGTVAVVLAFSAATIATMVTVVYLASRGLERLPLDAAERYSHALAGAALSLCGLGIVFLGL